MRELAARIPEAISIVLFGSEARGEAAAGSDTDLLIVVPEGGEAVEEQVREVCLELADKQSLALSWQVVSLAEVRKWEEAGNEFWRNVRRDGIRLYGKTPEGLRQLWRRGEVT